MKMNGCRVGNMPEIREIKMSVILCDQDDIKKEKEVYFDGWEK